MTFALVDTELSSSRDSWEPPTAVGHATTGANKFFLEPLVDRDGRALRRFLTEPPKLSFQEPLLCVDVSRPSVIRE